jgi:hypothetical protein
LRSESIETPVFTDGAADAGTLNANPAAIAAAEKIVALLKIDINYPPKNSCSSNRQRTFKRSGSGMDEAGPREQTRL